MAARNNYRQLVSNSGSINSDSSWVQAATPESYRYSPADSIIAEKEREAMGETAPPQQQDAAAAAAGTTPAQYAATATAVVGERVRAVTRSSSFQDALRSIKRVFKADNPTWDAETATGVLPLSSGVFSPVQVEMVTFSEVDTIPRGEILDTLAAINHLLKRVGPGYQLPIWVGTSVLLVVGGVIVGLIAGAVAGAYIHFKNKAARRALAEFLSAESDRAVYADAGAVWRLTDRGVELVTDNWNVVDVKPVEAVPVVETAPVRVGSPVPAAVQDHNGFAAGIYAAPTGTPMMPAPGTVPPPSPYPTLPQA